MKKLVLVILLIQLCTFAGFSQSIDLYRLIEYYDYGATTPNGSFVSLTHAFQFKDHPDSTVIAPEHLGAQTYDFSSNEFHFLKPTCRKRFLQQKGMKETDSIFIFHLVTDTVYAIQIKEVEIAAFVNPYGPSSQVIQFDYMVGFWLDEKQFPVNHFPYYYHSLFVSTGTKSPFTTGEVKAIKWRKTTADVFPTSGLSPEKWAYLKDFPREETYFYKSGRLTYFIQNYTPQYGQGRHLIVIDHQSGDIVFEGTYQTSEGAELLPLNDVSGVKLEVPYSFQWTGNLFNESPPMIYGFYSMSFGCDGVEFLDSETSGIYIQCDNRH